MKLSRELLKFAMCPRTTERGGFMAIMTGLAVGLGCASAQPKVAGPSREATLPTDHAATVGWMTAPEVPAPLRVPGQPVLVAHYRAVGAQVYACSHALDGSPAFSLEAPDAKLLDANQSASGTHSAGPSWRSADGSVVRGKKLAQADAPQSNAIPWLLIEANANEGAGIFSGVRYVQRVNTIGGKAPATGCDSANLGAKARADYTADYYFFGMKVDGGPETN